MGQIGSECVGVCRSGSDVGRGDVMMVSGFLYVELDNKI